MKNPKLVNLYGFASSDKTTLAKKYINEHPLTMAVEGDKIIEMIGQWRKNEVEARKMVFEHTKSIIENQLLSGYGVLLPYLLTDPTHAEEFENIAKKYNVPFLEIYIDIKKDAAIERLIERGAWGEEGSPTLTEQDVPEIMTLFETMTTAVCARRNVHKISNDFGDIEVTYKKFLQVVE